ncbi:MAG: antibiotic biosynthesis monooxygenase family protein [Pyrinomonadaceae bacterium]
MMDKINREDTIFNLARITVRPEHRRELCQTISSLIDPVESEKGCLMYRFYEEAGDENTFVVIGEWETPDAWNNHLKSDNFAVLLGSISLLCNSPHIDFKLLSHDAGIEAMTRARIECHSCATPATLKVLP